MLFGALWSLGAKTCLPSIVGLDASADGESGPSLSVDLGGRSLTDLVIFHSFAQASGLRANGRPYLFRHGSHTAYKFEPGGDRRTSHRGQAKRGS